MAHKAIDAMALSGPQRQVLIALVTLFVGSFIIGAVGRVEKSLVYRAEFDAHVQSDTSWKREQRELSMEVLCEVKPTSRKCR